MNKIFWLLIAMLSLVSLFHMETHFTQWQIQTGRPIFYELIGTPWGGFAFILLIIRFVGGAATARFRKAIRTTRGK